MDLDFNKIALSKTDNIGIITLNRPDIQNTLSYETLKEIDYALKLFESDNKIKVILLRSKCSASKKYNKIFSVGTNLKEYDKKFQLIESNPAEFEKIIKLNRSLLSKVETLKKPVIAGVDGLAVGGAFELILACDLIFASDEAKFALSEINIGLIPGYGGIQRLIRSIGKKKTFEIVSTGRILSAQEALIVGIVAEICSDSLFENKIMEYCKQLSQKSTHALRLIKDTIYQMTSKNIYDDIEIKNFIKAAAHPDAKEGISAFLEKEPPRLSEFLKITKRQGA